MKKPEVQDRIEKLLKEIQEIRARVEKKVEVARRHLSTLGSMAR